MPGLPGEVTWEVTAQDIDEGTRDDCRTCPVARSLMRAFPGFVPEVGQYEINLYTHQDDLLPAFRAQAPGAAGDFIRAFDDGEDPGPLTLTATFSVYKPGENA